MDKWSVSPTSLFEYSACVNGAGCLALDAVWVGTGGIKVRV